MRVEFQNLSHDVIKRIGLLDVVIHFGHHIFHSHLYTYQHTVDTLVSYLNPAFRVLLRTVQEGLSCHMRNNKGDDSEYDDNRQHHPDRQSGVQ